MNPSVVLWGREFNLYPVLGLLGIAAATLVAGTRRRRVGLAWDDLASLAVFAGLGAVAGAKLLSLALTLPRLSADLSRLPTAQVLYQYATGGLVFYGALPGGLLGLWWFCRFRGFGLGGVLRLAVPVLPLAHAFGRVGCFLAGCCHGIPWNPPLGIPFARAAGAPNHIPLLPVQLLEGAALLLLFGVLWGYTRRPRPTAAVVTLYLALYPATRFWLEFLRGDGARGSLWGLSTSQWISLLLLAGNLLAFLHRRRQKKPPRLCEPGGI